MTPLTTRLTDLVEHYRREHGGPPPVIRLRTDHVVRLAGELGKDPRELTHFGTSRIQLDDRMPEAACR